MIFPRVPYPARDGGAIAMNSLLKSMMSAHISLHVFFLNTSKHYVDEQVILEQYRQFGEIDFVNIDNNVTVWRAVQNLFTGVPFHLSRFRNKGASSRLNEILSSKKFDLIHFDGLPTTEYLEEINAVAPNVPVVLRAHNIEHLIWQRLASNSSILKKWYLRLQARRLQRREVEVINTVKSCVFISNADMKKGIDSSSGAVENIQYSIGTGMEVFKDRDRGFSYKLYHLGSLDWEPNVEGLTWFVKEVWPKIKNKKKQLSLSIAGRNMPSELRLWEGLNGVNVLGEIESTADFMSNHDILVVPLLSGSGIRIKILEAMASGKIVISTRIGAEGLAVEHGLQILLADTVDEFHKAIEFLSDQESRALLIENAYAYIRDSFSIGAIGEQFKVAYTEVVER